MMNLTYEMRSSTAAPSSNHNYIKSGKDLGGRIFVCQHEEGNASILYVSGMKPRYNGTNIVCGFFLNHALLRKDSSGEVASLTLQDHLNDKRVPPAPLRQGGTNDPDRIFALSVQDRELTFVEDIQVPENLRRVVEDPDNQYVLIQGYTAFEEREFYRALRDGDVQLCDQLSLGDVLYLDYRKMRELATHHTFENRIGYTESPAYLH